MRQKTDIEISQTIFLGGQISHKHKEYQRYARMTPEMARIDYIIRNLDDLLKKAPIEFLKEIVELLAITEGLKGFTELTRLSMILGDTRKRHAIGKKWKKKIAEKKK